MKNINKLTAEERKSFIFSLTDTMTPEIKAFIFAQTALENYEKTPQFAIALRKECHLIILYF